MLTALGSKEAEMKIIGCDLHAAQQTIAMLDRETGEIVQALDGISFLRSRFGNGTLGAGQFNVKFSVARAPAPRADRIGALAREPDAGMLSAAAQADRPTCTR